VVGNGAEFESDRAYKVAAELLATEQAYVDKLHLLDQVTCSVHSDYIWSLPAGLRLSFHYLYFAQFLDIV